MQQLNLGVICKYPCFYCNLKYTLDFEMNPAETDKIKELSAFYWNYKEFYRFPDYYKGNASEQNSKW